MENVPDILNYGGHNVVQEIVDALDGMGYEASYYSLINAVHHGVPQMRDRVYMIAFHRDVAASIRFPVASHKCDLPRGYASNRIVALRVIDSSGGYGFVEGDEGHDRLPDAVTARQAVGDLPAVTLHREGRLRLGVRRFTEHVPYRGIAWKNLSPYARTMRSWPGFEAGDGIYDHVIRYLPRDTRIFEAMQPGDEYPQARRIAERLFIARAKRRQLSPGTYKWRALRKAMVPPMIQQSFRIDGGSWGRTNLPVL
jgi:DNA (cytosine-5)-methyltransferase 1